MKLIDSLGNEYQVKIRRIGPDGYDWYTDDAREGFCCNLPLYDDEGNVVEPVAEITDSDLIETLLGI